jgi:hypothetical protein
MGTDLPLASTPIGATDRRRRWVIVIRRYPPDELDEGSRSAGRTAV